MRRKKKLQYGGDVTEVEVRIMQSEKTPWSCSLLESDRDKRRSALFSEHSYSFDPELKLIIRAVQDEIRELRKTMEFFKEKYEEEARRSKVLSEIVNEFSKDNEDLKKEVPKLKSVLKVQEQTKLEKNICISRLITENEVPDMQTSKRKVVKLLQS